MNACSSFVEALRAARPDLPDRLTPGHEQAAVAVLTPWFERLADVRRRYDAGGLTGEERASLSRWAQRRRVGYELAPMTDAERKAAESLFVMLAGHVAGITAEAFNRAARRASLALDLEDALSESFELFLQTLSAFDPSKASLSTWTGIDLPSKVTHFLLTHASHEQLIEEHDDFEDAGAEDVEHLVDFEAWAERFVAGDARLTAIWRALAA